MMIGMIKTRKSFNETNTEGVVTVKEEILFIIYTEGQN